MVPTHSLCQGTANVSEDDNLWWIIVMLNCVDVVGPMENGLFWTTQNISPPNGQLLPWKGRVPGYHRRDFQPSWAIDLVGCWKLHEFPDRPIAESRWTRSIILFAQSLQTLSEYQLGELTRERIFSAWVANSLGREMFQFDPKNPDEDINLITDSPICGGFGQCHLWFHGGAVVSLSQEVTSEVGVLRRSTLPTGAAVHRGKMQYARYRLRAALYRFFRLAPSSVHQILDADIPYLNSMRKACAYPFYAIGASPAGLAEAITADMCM
ncbi:hypothetical protein B0T25DRAFT_582468 [Lasiosphaeria hispida]|uniref:Uncharacterized protein n=1 Tax=Lasiosphaeria hispida TaxID=260671 RepID=A0AAJ0MCF9_9PEZI|nr:hypothetical protein B0T25DRAFT_582468 [Lasiosphaeria hispida]